MFLVRRSLTYVVVRRSLTYELQLPLFLPRYRAAAGLGFKRIDISAVTPGRSNQG